MAWKHVRRRRFYEEQQGLASPERAGTSVSHRPFIISERGELLCPEDKDQKGKNLKKLSQIAVFLAISRKFCWVKECLVIKASG